LYELTTVLKIQIILRYFAVSLSK